MTIAFVALVLVSAVTGYCFFYFQRDASVTGESGGGKPASPAEIGNPVQYFYKHFSSKDYRVTPRSASGQMMFDYYYEKGALIRVDPAGEYSGKSTIIKNGKVYTVDAKMKQFTESSIDDQKVSYTLEIMKTASFISPVIQGENPMATPWSEIPQDAGGNSALSFQASGRKFESYLPYSALVDVKIILDPLTGLLTSVSYQTQGKNHWTTATLEYEEIGDIESLKRFPADYKKIDPT